MFRKYFIMSFFILIILFVILATLEFRKNQSSLGFGMPVPTTLHLVARLG